MLRSLVAVALFAVGCGNAPEGPVTAIETRNLSAHVRFLASDLLEGRGVGGRGEALTTEYLAAQLRLAGAEPAAMDGSFFQRVPLVEIKAQPGSRLEIAGRSLVALDEYVGNNERQTAREAFDAEIVFVGRGIVAPEFGWDDYKDADVRGKVVLLFTNEPPSDDSGFFGGRALTYYGRWTFKYEEAARRGALGALIVHTDETAGYPWDVVRNSWSGSQPYMALEEGEYRLAMAGWLHSDAAQRVIGASNVLGTKTLDELLAMANSEDFQPVPLGLNARSDLRSSIIPIESRNVLAKFQGSDPALREEAVLYTAHWDHLGMQEVAEGEDGIYNGAVDNATGCAVLLEIARVFGRMAETPKRTILFALVGAEESGLIGSAYYAAHPAVPMGRTAANLNFDGLYPFGKTTDFSLPGYERTSLKGTVESLAIEFGVSLTPDAHPEQGYYYRSDQFSLAKQGVPAFSLKTGSRFAGRPEGWGDGRVGDYRSEHYHQPSDEFREDWDFGGIADLAEFGLELGTVIANQPELPTWAPGDEFLAARERSWQ